MSKKLNPSEKINAIFYDILGYQLSTDGSWWTNDWNDNQTQAVTEAREAMLKLINDEVVSVIDNLEDKLEKYRNEKGESRFVVTQKTLLSEKRKHGRQL